MIQGFREMFVLPAAPPTPKGACLTVFLQLQDCPAAVGVPPFRGSGGSKGSYLILDF